MAINERALWADCSGRGNINLTMDYIPRIRTFLQQQPGHTTTLDQIYTRLNLYDIPMYIAVQILIVTGEALGISPYDFDCPALFHNQHVISLNERNN